MAGRRPWPLDPTKLGACDYDEIVEAQNRQGKSNVNRRKLFSIESRLVPTKENSITHTFGLDQWFVHGRYVTEHARDQAFNVLTQKSERELGGWSRMEWRKIE